MHRDLLKRKPHSVLRCPGKQVRGSPGKLLLSLVPILRIYSPYSTVNAPREVPIHVIRIKHIQSCLFPPQIENTLKANSAMNARLAVFNCLVWRISIAINYSIQGIIFHISNKVQFLLSNQCFNKQSSADLPVSFV